MAITRVSQSTVKEGLEKANNFLAGFAPLEMDYHSIATIIASGSDGGGGHTFTSIPQTFQHLRLHVLIRSARSAATDFLFIRLNSDVGNNYAWHSLQGNGSAASAVGYATGSNSYMAFAAADNMPASSATANLFGVFAIDILDYANTSKTTTVRVFGGYDANGSGVVALGSGMWTSTAAVTSISVGSAVQIPVSGTQYALYGLRAP